MKVNLLHEVDETLQNNLGYCQFMKYKEQEIHKRKRKVILRTPVSFEEFLSNGKIRASQDKTYRVFLHGMAVARHWEMI